MKIILKENIEKIIKKCTVYICQFPDCHTFSRSRTENEIPLSIGLSGSYCKYRLLTLITPFQNKPPKKQENIMKTKAKNLK